MTYTKAGSFGFAGGGKSGALVDLWLASRFPNPPGENQAPPVGVADSVQVTTGPSFGNPGAYVITGITVAADYYVRVQYGGVTYWASAPQTSLSGSAIGTVSSVSGTVQNGFVPSIVSPTTTPQITIDTLPWQSYTPVITASLAPTIGNGTLTGSYLFLGTTLFFNIHLLWGSTTGTSSGSFSFSLPVTCAASQVAACRVFDSSSGQFAPAVATVLTGGSTVSVTFNISGTGSTYGGANFNGTGAEVIINGVLNA